MKTLTKFQGGVNMVAKKKACKLGVNKKTKKCLKNKRAKKK
jgi:hypothetical protein